MIPCYLFVLSLSLGLPWWLRRWSVCPQCRRPGFNPCVGKIPWRKWQPTPVFLPGKSHGLRNLVGYSPWGHKEWDRTERLHFHFLSLGGACPTHRPFCAPSGHRGPFPLLKILRHLPSQPRETGRPLQGLGCWRNRPASLSGFPLAISP